MELHELSEEDRNFRSAFEACTVTPSQFNHEAHVRLAYVYLVEPDLDPIPVQGRKPMPEDAT